MTTFLYFFIKDLLVFKGRVNRKEFVFFYLICFTTAFILFVLFGFIHFSFSTNLVLRGCFILIAAFALLCFVQSFAITARRLHDINFSGWWQLPIIFFPFGQLMFLVLCFIKGSDGVNKYGEPYKSSKMGDVKYWKFIILYSLMFIFVLGIVSLINYLVPIVLLEKQKAI